MKRVRRLFTGADSNCVRLLISLKNSVPVHKTWKCQDCTLVCWALSDVKDDMKERRDWVRVHALFRRLSYRYFTLSPFKILYCQGYMSSTNSTAADVDAVVSTKVAIVRTWCFLQISLGTMGHPLSIYVFTRPTLRSNPCARYFLAATIGGIFMTHVSTPIRLLQTGYNIDFFGYSLASCKILTFLLLWARSVNIEDDLVYRFSNVDYVIGLKRRGTLL